MDYSRALTSGATDNEILALFSDNFDPAEFTKELNHVLAQLWTGSDKSSIVVGRVFTVGVAQFAKYVKASEKHSEIPADKDAASDSVGEPAPLTEIASESAVDFHIAKDEDGDDITDLSKFKKRKASLAELFDTVDISDLGSSKIDGTLESISSVLEESSDMTHLAKLSISANADELSEPELNDAIGRIADVLTIWVGRVSRQAQKHGKDAFSMIFGPPGFDKIPNDSQMHELLAQIKTFMEKAIVLNDLERAGALRKLVILIHEIVHALFVALTLEAGLANANDIVIVKSLLYSFFQVDFSHTLNALLARTTGKQFPIEDQGNSSASSTPAKAELRLSYETVMKIYGIYVSLATCPINLVLVDKVSLSLDITTPEDTSPNVYTHSLEHLDFTDDSTYSSWNTRLMSQMTALYYYYYELSPDILCHSLRHSSFFGWITGNLVTSGAYFSIDTKSDIIRFSETPLDPVDPFLFENNYHERTKKLKHFRKNTDVELAVRSPSFLAITLIIFQLLHNKSFVRVFIGDTDLVAEPVLLDLWLCVSSYVHHYQYKTAVNSFGARVSLLIMLKLTSPKSPTLPSIRNLRIDENRWKLCHHKHPVVPLDESRPEKDAMFYIIDILQVTFRHNLSKKLDLENAKIALTVLYQILLDLEANPTEGLRTYAWNDLYHALVTFLKFISRSQNDEGVKYVIEEIFSVFQLLLSPVFDKVVEVTDDVFSLGYHPAKSVNFDLLYIMLQQQDSMEAIFDKYINCKDNFARVERAFSDFKSKLSSTKGTDLQPSDVTKILNELGYFDNDTSEVTEITMDKFNYADTFKYLDQYRDYEDFPKEQELINAFISLLETDWVGEIVKKP